ncbi:hypothetical protein C8J32_10326 [Rhizobium sp. PP-CC-3A-592]|nr:hypothetical protein C8J32_10326 [Rhizobium sp. PP-CC-3A-592]
MMTSLSGARDDMEIRERFRLAMDREDFDGAITLLTNTASPVRRLESLVFVEGRWKARVSAFGSSRFRTLCAHPHKTTSVLMALLLSDESGRPSKL